MGEIRSDEVLPSSSDDSDFTTGMDYRDQLERNRLSVVQTLDLERHFMFNYLRSNNIFDEEDCDIIQNYGATRQQKNAKFLDILATRGPKAFNVFVEALEYDLPSLYEVFTGRKPQVKNGELDNFFFVYFKNCLLVANFAVFSLGCFFELFLLCSVQKIKFSV